MQTNLIKTILAPEQIVLYATPETEDEKLLFAAISSLLETTTAQEKDYETLECEYGELRDSLGEVEEALEEKKVQLKAALAEALKFEQRLEAIEALVTQA